MTTQNETAEERLTRLLTRVEQIGRSIHTDGRRNQPIRESFLRELRASVDAAAALGAREAERSDSEPVEVCGCGDRITWHAGEWLHILNPALRGTDHPAEPAGGYYEPGGDDLEEA